MGGDCCGVLIGVVVSAVWWLWLVVYDWCFGRGFVVFAFVFGIGARAFS